jgi:hypothetical protein
LASNDKNGDYTNGILPLISSVPIVTTPYSQIVPGFFTGMLNVSNLSLYTSPGYVLDVKVIFLINLGYDVTVQVICNPSGSSGLQISIM